MAYKERWTALEGQLKSIQTTQPPIAYIRDGVVNLEQWQNQKLRPLFLGKEAHNGKAGANGGGWSISEVMNERPARFCRESPRSWRKTSCISYALQNSICDYSALQAIRNANKVAEALRNIAFINVGKLAGKTQTPMNRLHELYALNRVLLHEQIMLCQPNIIIGWGTLSLFESDPLFMSRFGRNKVDASKIGRIRSWHSDGRLFVAAPHPAYFRIKGAAYVGDVLKAIGGSIQYIDQSLPNY